MSKINDISSNDLTIILDSILNKEKGLISHHIDSINKFNESGIKQIMVNGFLIRVELNNDRDQTDEDKLISKYLMEARVTDVRLLPPVTINYDTQRSQILFPGEAHLKDLTYSSPMYIDADIVCTAYKTDGTTEIKKEQIQNYRLGSIPIMVGSKLCNSYNKSRDTLIELNEDPTDLGGYFIIKSNEWIIDNIESMTYNLSREFKNVGFKNELARSEIISKPGDNFENSSSLLCKYLNNGNINFEITNNKFRDISIPFYVLFRAFGVCSDGEIIEHITYSMNDGDPTIKKMLNILETGFASQYSPISDAYQIHNQTDILELIGKHINDFYLSNLNTASKNNTNTRKYNINNVLQILDKDILPHIGLTSDDRYKKIRFLGHIINRLLLVYLDIIPPTDRDSYKNKRINPAGVSYAKVFKTNFNFAIVQQLRRQFTKDLKATTFSNLNLKHSFETAIYGHEFERALIQAIVTGDKTININRKAVQNRLSSQQLHRKNQINVISALRNINTANSSSAKQSARANEMRRFHSSMIGYVCCVQSADTGEKVGMQKQMAISSKISLGSSSDILKDIILSDNDLIILNKNLTNLEIYTKKLTKVFVNGDWLGCCLDFASFGKRYREMRRNNKIHYLTTITFDVKSNELHLWVDIGRITRPLILIYNNEDEYYKSNKTIEFRQYINLTKEHIINLNAGIINYETLLDDNVIEFISPEEQQNCLIAKDIETLNQYINDPLMRYTHLDISQAIIGIPGLTSPFSNHNQAARVVFQTNQVKQTCGIPCLNFPFKSYKEMHLQVYNQKPLVKTIANKYYAPIGMNAIVAVMIYGGYNQEDSLIINQGAVDRGLFTTHHFTFEKTELEKNEEFTNPDPSITADIKAYSNYDKLLNGVVPRGTYIKSGDIIIGKIAKLNKVDQYDNFKYYDKSIVYKYDEPAYVWDVIKGRNEEDNLFCKVIFRSARKVAIGDKFCLDDTHDVLTSTGWKSIDTVTTKDQIAILDGDVLKYELPSEMNEFYHDGDLYNVDSRGMDITCTMNHKLYIRQKNNKNYELVKANDIINKEYNGKKNCKNENEHIEYFTLPSFTHEKYSIYNKNEINLDMCTWIEFFGIYIAGGHIDNNKMVRISAHTERIREKLNIILPKLNLEYIIYEKDYYYLKCNLQLSNYLNQFGKGINKYLPDFVWNLSQDQSKLLLDSLMLGNSQIYYTGSENLANDVQKLSIHCGFSSIMSIKNIETVRKTNQYAISITKDLKCLEPKISNKTKSTIITIINKKCKVYCPTVSTGIFMIRKNGKCIWTGNSSRSGQKGVVGISYRDSDMPYTEDGIKPDIIFNPHSLPSRMTMGVLFEAMASKANAINGTITDGTIFKKIDIDDLADDLAKVGYNRNGTERLYNGITGNYIDVEIFIGPIYYQRLQKFTVDTVYSHKTCPTDAITHQPLDGKSAKGGLRLGEMEKDVMAISSVKFLQEKFIDHSDVYHIYVCKKCNKRAVVNEKYQIYKCKYCNDNSDIVKIKTSWSCKQMFDEIESCNIGLKLYPKENTYQRFE